MITVTKESHVATVTLNRPEAANSLSIALLQQLRDAFYTLSYNRDVRVIIVTGAGNQFCAGADLKERKGMSDVEARQAIALIGDVVNACEAMSQPVIAAMNGAAFGGGLELALACDIRIASSSAKMGLTEAALGIIPGAGGTQRLPRLIGIGRAKELIYTARRLTADEALAYGIVEYVVSPEQLLAKANELATEIASNAPLSLKQAKIAIHEGMQVDLHTGLKVEQLAYAGLFHSADRLEGLAAFAEKRKPQYTGR